MSQYQLHSNGGFSFANMQKMIVKIMAMNDAKTKQKAMEAVADVNGTYIITLLLTYSIYIYVYVLICPLSDLLSCNILIDQEWTPCQRT